MAHDPDMNPGERDPYEPLFGPAAEARYTREELEARRKERMRAIDARTVGIKSDLTDEGMSDYALLSDPRNVQLRKDFEHLLEPNGLDRDGKPLGAANQTLRPNALQSNLDQAQAFGDQLTVGRYTNPLSPQHAERAAVPPIRLAESNSKSPQLLDDTGRAESFKLGPMTVDDDNTVAPHGLIEDFSLPDPIFSYV